MEREGQTEREARTEPGAADTPRWSRTSYLLTAAAGCAACVPGCPDRSAECHGRCEAYQAWSHGGKKQDARFADRDRHGEVTAYIRDNWAKKQKEGEACHRVTLRRRCGAPSIFHRLREQEIHCEGHMAGCTLVSQFGRLADMKEQMESVCQKNYEACAIYRMVMAEKYGGDKACRA